MRIDPAETLLRGNWLLREGRVVADETCHRIDRLVHSHLEVLKKGADGWEVLLRDPDDGRLWELTFPDSGFHGGGPPLLRCLGLHEAVSKYGSFSGSA
jgi:hypothetical protein